MEDWLVVLLVSWNTLPAETVLEWRIWSHSSHLQVLKIILWNIIDNIMEYMEYSTFFCLSELLPVVERERQGGAVLGPGLFLLFSVKAVQELT